MILNIKTKMIIRKVSKTVMMIQILILWSILVEKERSKIVKIKNNNRKNRNSLTKCCRNSNCRNRKLGEVDLLKMPVNNNKIKILPQ